MADPLKLAPAQKRDLDRAVEEHALMTHLAPEFARALSALYHVSHGSVYTGDKVSISRGKKMSSKAPVYQPRALRRLQREQKVLRLVAESIDSLLAELDQGKSAA